MANWWHIQRLKLCMAILKTLGLNLFVFNEHLNLKDANLSSSDLISAELDYADLNNADLRGAKLMGASLYRADLRNADLTNADLRGASLYHTVLTDAVLKGTNLHDAHLHRAELLGTDLSGANLKDTRITYSNLRNANLSSVNLQDSELRSCDLSGIKLVDTNLSGAYMSSNFIANVDFRKAKKLVEVNHSRPSLVQLHTIQLPQDGSALHFLRGTGVPDEWIDFYLAQMMHPIQYHSCFISYAHQDEMLAHRLHADLQAHGVRCWFAPEDMKIGDKIRSHIDEAIHMHEKLLLLLSEHAIASAWVEDEVEAALEKEQRQQREVIFPIQLDESVMQTSLAWAAKLRRTRHIGDFSDWKDHDEYQIAFERLLRDLKDDGSS